MDKPDLHALSEEYKIDIDTLRKRWAKGWRGDKLTQPVMSRSAQGRKGMLKSPWYKQSPAITKRST